MDRQKSFQVELDYIQNKDIRFFTRCAIEILPDYFFSIGASSTGKYHPSYSLGDGGLYRHTCAAVRIAIELARLDWWHFNSDEIDLCIASLILHDGWKNGLPQQTYSLVEHPLIAVMELRKLYIANEFKLSKKYFQLITDNISTHMGQWIQDPKTKKNVLYRPKTPMQKFTHLADYISSRKCLEMNFEVPVTRE